MAFLEKTDFCGLAAKFQNAIQVRDDNENASSQTYAPATNDGDIFVEEVYGDDSAPSNNYAIKATVNNTANDPLKIGAGAVKTVNQKKFALETLTVNTSAGTPVAISATCQELEADAADTGTCFIIPPFKIETKHKAQDIFGAINSVTNATMTQLNHTIGCTITKDKIAGLNISSDANSGLITITGRLLQKSTAQNAAAPTITVTDGWTIRQKLTRTNPESSYPEYAFTLTRALALYVAAPAA